MKKLLFHTFLTCTLLLLCGCGNSEETPPLSRERTQLIIRLFESMQKNDRAGIINRAEKLKKLAPDNAYINHVIETHTAQTYILHAQKAIDEGHYDLAVQILEKGLQKHPLNHTLNTQHKNLTMLIELEKSVKKGDLQNIPSDLHKIPKIGPELVKKIKSLQAKK